MLNRKKRNNNNNKSSSSSSCVFIGGVILGMVVGIFIYLQYNDNNDNDTLDIENQYLTSSQMDSTLLMPQRQDSKLKAQLHKELEIHELPNLPAGHNLQLLCPLSLANLPNEHKWQAPCNPLLCS